MFGFCFGFVGWGFLWGSFLDGDFGGFVGFFVVLRVLRGELWFVFFTVKSVKGMKNCGEDWREDGVGGLWGVCPRLRLGFGS